MKHALISLHLFETLNLGRLNSSYWLFSLPVTDLYRNFTTNWSAIFPFSGTENYISANIVGSGVPEVKLFKSREQTQSDGRLVRLCWWSRLCCQCNAAALCSKSYCSRSKSFCVHVLSVARNIFHFNSWVLFFHFLCVRVCACVCVCTFLFYSLCLLFYDWYLTGITNLSDVSFFFNTYLSIYFLTSMYFTAVDFVKYVVHLIMFVSDSFDVAVRLSLLKSIISYCFIWFFLRCPKQQFCKYCEHYRSCCDVTLKWCCTNVSIKTWSLNWCFYCSFIWVVVRNYWKYICCYICLSHFNTTLKFTVDFYLVYFRCGFFFSWTDLFMNFKWFQF